MNSPTLDQKVNYFAYRCFRDIADGDYIAARMACRAGLLSQFLWASQQALEKYLKCILLLNRIPATNIGHRLHAALDKAASGRLDLGLSKSTVAFIEHIDAYGVHRYQEVSQWAWSSDLIRLDRSVWELRRFCTGEDAPKRLRLQEGVVAPRVLLDGYLETILSRKSTDPARSALIWQNAFFGERGRRVVRLPGWIRSTNAPLFTFPEIVDEIIKFVQFPRKVEAAFRQHWIEQQTNPHYS